MGRLRDYDIAVCLLLQARREWARHMAREKELTVGEMREGSVRMSLDPLHAEDTGEPVTARDEHSDNYGGAGETGRLLQEALASSGGDGTGDTFAGRGPPGERLYDPEVDFERIFGEHRGSANNDDALPLEVNLFF